MVIPNVAAALQWSSVLSPESAGSERDTHAFVL
jgi:hypothetical protein